VQLVEDTSPLAHPVRPQSYIEISNFYTTTIYEKGAEVVRMYQTLLGPEKFRAATDLYFDRHDGEAATTDDFAAVMEEVGRRDLSQFKRWYEQAGTPLVEVEETFADNALQLTLRQSCPPTPGQQEKQPFVIPIELGLLDADGEPVSLYDLQIDCDSPTRAVDNGNTLLVELEQAQSTLSISFLEAKPMVSFLRSFSAPVKVAYPRDDAELAFLVQHDTDGFVRWDALQTLWLRMFNNSGPDLVELVGEVLQQTLAYEDPELQQLAAKMLTIPEPNYLFEQIPDFDLDAILDTRDRIKNELAETHQQHWQTLYETCTSDAPFSVDARGMARRVLRNLAFDYLTHALTGDALNSFVQRHYDSADNLTDRRAALAAAINVTGLDGELRQQMVNDFYAKWQHEALVIDLWYSLQAQSPESSVADLKALSALPSFELTNPNRARSLYAAFGMYNHRRFHALDGSGYRFLAESIARIDEINPQMAARLATPLTRWSRYDATRQGLMKQALTELAAGASLSKDLFEIVTKSLPA
ncbi:MAG: DUF3458 domain-containing protein, partial [Pseudomonadales bacterium]